MKIVLATSGQPSTNPRLVKEADALANAGYEVVVLYQYWNSWATKTDKDLLKAKPWRAVRVGGSPYENKILYTFRRVLNKAVTTFFNSTLLLKFPEIAINSNYYFLYRAIIKESPSLIIGHNLGSLPSVVNASKKLKIKCGFDAEDFHRFEESDNIDNAKVKLKKIIEDKYLQQTSYRTAASPLIAEAYNKIYPDFEFSTIYNVFNNYKIGEIEKSPSTLRLFWFSQTIGKNRGLEDVFAAMKHLPDEVSLTLVGELNESNKSYFSSIMKSNNIEHKRINFIAPVHPDQITEIAAKYDIGLALEPKRPMNRDLCLTNKIFTYMNAGLVTIASDTTAQKQLLDAHPQIGDYFSAGNEMQLFEKIKYYLNNFNQLLMKQKEAKKLADTSYNWELESNKFLKIVELQFIQSKSNFKQ